MAQDVSRAMELPSLCVVEARRVFGENAVVSYGARWATAGECPDEREDDQAFEITVWSDDPLEMLLRCLRAPTEVE